MALGATPNQVQRTVLSRAFQLTIFGVAGGAVGSFALSRYMQSVVFGVNAADPLSIMSACAVLIGIAILSAYIPARRTARLDPVNAVRSE